MLSNIITLNTFTDLGLMIFVGMALGRLVKKIKLPNVTGYLLAGLLLGPSILGLLSEEFLSGITVISDAALGFIAFSIGNEFKISYFKRVGATPIIIACLESFFAVAFVTVALMLAGCSTTFSLVLGSIAAATALSGGNATVKDLVLKPIIEIGGALVVGAILGFLFLLPMKAFKKDGNRLSLIIAFIFVGLGLSQLCGFSSLLLCMAMGAIVANFSPDVNQIMKLSDRITPPIFMLFFVASGADLKLSVLPAVGLVGVIYIVVRVVGKMFGASLGAIVCKADKKIQKYLGPALVPQAGVAIGLSLAASSVVPEHASEIRTVILCGTLIYELVGPVIAKTCLKKAGEITEA